MALTTAEVNRLFDLLRDLHGRDRPRDPRTLAIWSAVLEPWEYAQVRRAAVERARHSRYFPDPGELAEYLPERGKTTPAGATKPQHTGEADRKARQVQQTAYRRWKGERQRLTPLRRQAGVPADPMEAVQAGIPLRDWREELRKRGVDMPDTAFAG